MRQGSGLIKAARGADDLVWGKLCKLGLERAPLSSPTTLNWITLLAHGTAKLVLNRGLAKNSVDVVLHTRIFAATRTSDKISSVTWAGLTGRMRSRDFDRQRAKIHIPIAVPNRCTGRGIPVTETARCVRPG